MAKIVNLSEFSNDSLEKSASANETGISRIFNYNGSNVTFKIKKWNCLCKYDEDFLFPYLSNAFNCKLYIWKKCFY